MKSRPCVVVRPVPAEEMHERKRGVRLPEWDKLLGQETERRGGFGRARRLGTAPVLEQGECKAAVYVSQAEDPHCLSDSVAESDEECPGARLRLQGVPGDARKAEPSPFPSVPAAPGGG